MANISRLNVNGSVHAIEADERVSLLSVLREEMDLTGAKYGCGEGQCGACTVLIDGQPTRSCITPASAVGKKPITTIEGLAGKIHGSGSQLAAFESDAKSVSMPTRRDGPLTFKLAPS